MINVTKTYLPPFDEYAAILKQAWDKSWITNNGELVKELEEKLKQYLGVRHLWYTANGTIVLQMALKALNITKEVITTPFSYVATTNAILWEGCTPVFADIDPASCCIDASKIEACITENTEAILITHVFGIPCDLDRIQKIAEKHQLKVIYDGAHAFGCTYKGKSLLDFGDISTCSFHATKLFHTVEGGCIICNDADLADTLLHYRQFGHIGEEYFSMGINAKNSEFHAAMGLAVLPKIGEIICMRKKVSELYDRLLDFTEISLPLLPSNLVYNYGYYPVIFKNVRIVLDVMKALLENKVSARRYFYPSLNKLHFLKTYQSCPVSEAISSRILTLPLYHDLDEIDVRRIATIVNEEAQK